MVAADGVTLAAAVAAGGAAVVLVGLVVALARQVRQLRSSVERLEREVVPLVVRSEELVGHAIGELARVEAVLEGTESVTATVDSASRIAHRAFANPVVKVLAAGAGTATGLRRLREPETDRRRGR